MSELEERFYTLFLVEDQTKLLVKASSKERKEFLNSIIERAVKLNTECKNRIKEILDKNELMSIDDIETIHNNCEALEALQYDIKYLKSMDENNIRLLTSYGRLFPKKD